MKKIKLKIYLLDDTEYVGIIEETENGIKIDTIMDRDEYEKMLKFLINNGDINIKKKEDYKENVEVKKITNIENLLENLKHDFEIKYKEL